MLDTAASSRAHTFLASFEAALSSHDVEAVVEHFAEECYWRDLIAFTWNIKTMEGRDQIRDMLTACLERVAPSNWRIADGEVPLEHGEITEVGSRSRLSLHGVTDSCACATTRSGPS
jgi:putative flavoprotein involved in K+ transport